MEERLKAMLRLIVHDLDNARADGTTLTYGYVQERIREVINAAEAPVGERDE